VRKADNLPSSVAVVMKYGNLNFLEPRGPLRACSGTALPTCTHSMWISPMFTALPRDMEMGVFPWNYTKPRLAVCCAY